MRTTSEVHPADVVLAAVALAICVAFFGIGILKTIAILTGSMSVRAADSQWEGL